MCPQDVKNENVLLEKDGTALLADFGLARRGEGAGAKLLAPFGGYTRGFASPEVLAIAESRQRCERKVVYLTLRSLINSCRVRVQRMQRSRVPQVCSHSSTTSWCDGV